MNVLKYSVQRCLQAIPSVLAVTIVVFSLIRLTGDPASLLLGDYATPESVETLREQWGLNDPLWVQYGRYLSGLLQGDLGDSIRYSRPVSQMIFERFQASILLALSAIFIAVVVAVPLGITAAIRWRSKEDVAVRMFVVVGQAVPRFYLAILLMLLFGLSFGWLPTSGYGTVAHLVLPAVTLATPTAVLLTRLTRSSVLDVMHQDYVRTARSKGLKERTVLYRHVLRNALIAPLTMMAIQAAQLLGGAVVVETVFSWPGLGRLAVTSVYTRDFPLIQGIVLIFSLIVISTNVLVDIAYSFIDPRIRYAD